jgi:peptidyl-tRNA hydrolase
MARQRDELNEQVAAAMKQIEELRLRQEHLLREKSDLEALARRQANYLSSKREILARLRAGLVAMQRQEVEAVKAQEVLHAACARFEETAMALSRLREDEWADKSFDAELAKAIALVEHAQGLYQRTTAQIEALGWQGAGPDSKASPIVSGPMPDLRTLAPWFLRGLAFTLPVIVFALIVLMVRSLR